MLIRIYLGCNDRDGIPCTADALDACREVVADTWESFTTYQARGCFRGAAEACLVFEAFRTGPDEVLVAKHLACVLASVANQQCVGVAVLPASFELVGAAR